MLDDFLELLNFFGGFVVLMLVVVGSLLLATFFVASEHGMVPLRTNKSKGNIVSHLFIFSIYM